MTQARWDGAQGHSRRNLLQELSSMYLPMTQIEAEQTLQNLFLLLS